MLESLNTGIFEYEKLKPEEMQRRGILGRLVGVMADTVKQTRNGRSYSAKLWENVFNNPIMKERIENNCCFGELGHPVDREETDMEKIAICMDGFPKKDKDGKLQAVFNILDTPNGRILKTLCDYGCNIGISSRGSGDLIEDFDGNESVDPDTYNCEGWDAVLIPAVKEARLKYVTESLDKKRYNKTLRTRLQEAILKESEDNQKTMKDSLDNLGIDLDAKMDADFGDDLSLEDDISIDDTPLDDVDNSSVEDENTIFHKGIKILHSPRTDKYYCEIDGESYTFNNEKNAKIWIDMNIEDKSLTEEQVGREDKLDKNIDDVMSPETEQPVEKEKEEDKDKITITVNESIDWNNLNGTEQFAVDRIINAMQSGELRKGDPEEFNYVVRSVTNMYGDANEYLDPDDPMYNEEGSYGRVKDYLLNSSYYKDQIKDYFGLNNLTEDAYTKDELMDKFGTDDLDIINAGNEETVSLEQTYPVECLYDNITDDNFETFYKHFTVKANSEEEALRKAEELVNSNDYQYNHIHEYNHRDFKISDTKYTNSALVEDVDDIQMARINLCQLLDDWYTENIAPERSSDVKKAGWNSDLQQLYINFRNELNPDFIDIEEPIEEVDNIESDIDGLREMLEHNANLEKQITDLQEKLSVSYAMEKKLNEDIESYKEKITKLSKNSKSVKNLTEQLNEARDSASKVETKLNESQKDKKSLIEKLNKVTSERDNTASELKTLKEDYEVLNSDLNQTKDQFSKKFERQNKLLEKYQKITKNAVDKYIDVQATHLGMKPVEIKNKLPEKFSFNDIDSICESLRDYKLNVSMLPFNTSSSLNEGINAKAVNISSNLLPKNEVDDLTDYDVKLMEAYL